MAGGLLTVLTVMAKERRHNIPTKPDSTFQHGLCHDFESLIWVVVYAMMIHHRNHLAATDPELCELYKRRVDECWAVHAYSHLHRSHYHMIMVGTAFDSQFIVSSWFPDPREAAFFRDAMRLVCSQVIDGVFITYDDLCRLFKKHIRLAKEQQAFANDPR